MEALVKPIEALLMPLFKSLPSLPDDVRKTLVKIWPWAALVIGVLQVYSLFSLWQLTTITYGFGLGARYGMGFFFYLGLLTLALNGVLMLCAFSPLRKYKKSGWDLLLLGATVYLVYGVLMMLEPHYGSAFGSLLGAIISSAVAYYFLFQVRDYYTGAKKMK
ncbi:MAG: hypothetical protein PVI21_02290 [Candidatus Woesebacteria bacterium]|jgi:hypothetical protein